MHISDCRPPGCLIYELTFAGPETSHLEPLISGVVVRVVAVSEGDARRSAETVLASPVVKQIPDGSFMDPELVACEVVGAADVVDEVGAVYIYGRRPDWLTAWPYGLRGCSNLH